MSAYPEHEKLAMVAAGSRAIGEFLDWLTTDRGLEIAAWGGPQGNRLAPAGVPFRDLLAEYFQIDQQKVDDENRAALAQQRRLLGARA